MYIIKISLGYAELYYDIMRYNFHNSHSNYLYMIEHINAL